MKWNHALVAGAIALATVITANLPFAHRLDSLSIDSLFVLRHQLYKTFPSLKPALPESHIAVIGIDEETYQTEPFKAIPKVMWTPQYAEIIETVFEADASVLGFDVVLPTSAETFLPGFDKPFLKALYKHGRKQDNIVLGKVQHQNKPVAPHRAHSFAVNNEKNIRLLNLGTFSEDEDIAVLRYLPLWFESSNIDGTKRKDSSMAVELAARHLGITPQPQENGELKFGDYTVPSRLERQMLVNFDTTPGAIPTYSLADLHHCIEKGNIDYFKRHFANKIILLGTILDLEDRKLTSMRLAKETEGQVSTERCVIDYDKEKWAHPYVRDDIPGVYFHAQAVNNLINKNALIEFKKPAYALLTLPLVLLIAWLSLKLSAFRAVLALVVGSVIWGAIVLAGFHKGYVLPLFDPMAASAITFAMLLAFRYTVTDKDKRLIKQAFGYYLEPAVIDSMMEDGNQPELGGEIRDLTVWFSDIANYTSISEQLTATELVEFLNKYFSAMTDIVKEHGGFVDKYVGDAIIAVFGAPAHDPEHALKAVQSAIACNKKLREIQDSFGLPGNMKVAARIGVNTGAMLVGNIGSYNRLNYTIMGDAVNLASRIEGVNKMYGTDVMISNRTRKECGDHLQFREIDTVRVKGREAPETLFEPLDELNAPFANDYADALQDFRMRNFKQAVEKFSELAQRGDFCSQKMQIRARAFADEPPPADWDQINTLDTK
jgi:class 3 adenylate cyclase